MVRETKFRGVKRKILKYQDIYVVYYFASYYCIFLHENKIYTPVPSNNINRNSETLACMLQWQTTTANCIICLKPLSYS